MATLVPTFAFLAHAFKVDASNSTAGESAYLRSSHARRVVMAVVPVMRGERRWYLGYPVIASNKRRPNIRCAARASRPMSPSPPHHYWAQSST